MPGGTEIFMVQATPVGYAAITERHELAVVPPHRWTFIAKQGPARIEPNRTALKMGHLRPGEMTDLEHLLFALKHEGVFLPVLDAYLERVGIEQFASELSAAVRDQPTSKYVRVLWFLFEWLTGKPLDVADLDTGNYVPVLDPASYFAGPARRIRRQRVLDNLLGDRSYCPFVRRTEPLAIASPAPLQEALAGMVATHDPGVLSRALSYLYSKETLSSFAIERETPRPDRTEKFIRILQRVGEVGAFDEPTLVRLQNDIVDPRYAEPAFRTEQNFVGESVSLTRQLVHFIPPRPDALPELMAAWRATSVQLAEASSPVDAVVAAACVAYGFVYLHPFIDGNGRLHRFLVHQVLARRGVTPRGLIVPVSAVMLARRAEYDASLEVFSKPLLEVVDHELHEDGSITVETDTRRHYRFIDLTEQATCLYAWLEAAIRDELPAELDFLIGLDRARAAMRAIVDQPDRLADLFVKVVLQNGGRLSQSKRDSHFHQLSADEIARLEEVVDEHMPKRSRM